MSDKLSRNNKAYEAIKKRIMEVEYLPGETLSESRISEELGMSRTPVREAFNRLVQEGLLQSKGSRTRVAVISIDDLRQIFEAKQALETMIASLAAEKATDKDRKTMQEYIIRMEEMKKRIAAREPSFSYMKEWKPLNYAFHEDLYRIAGNSRIEQIVDTLNQFWHGWRNGIMRIEALSIRNINEHIDICAAIVEKDPKKAGEAMKEHLDSLFNTVKEVITTFGRM